MADENMRREYGPESTRRDYGSESVRREYGPGVPTRESNVNVYSAGPGVGGAAYASPYRPGLLRRVSWGAIFAGAVVAVSVQFMLAMLGLAIGMATVNPATQQNPGQGLAVGAGIWWIVTGIISLFCGGWVAGRLAAFPRWIDATLQGLVVWGLSAVAMLWLLGASVSSIVGGALTTVKDTTVAAASNPNLTQQAQRAMSQAQDQGQGTMGRLQNQAQGIFGTNEPGQGGRQQYRDTTGDRDVDQMLMQELQSRGTVSQATRVQAARALTDRTDMSRDEAISAVNQFVDSHKPGGSRTEEEAAAKAREVGQKAADVTTNAAVWGFLTLLLGAIAGAWGGALGRPAATGAADERLPSMP